MKSFNEIYEEIYRKNNYKLENLRKHELKKEVVLYLTTILIFILIILFFLKGHMLINFCILAVYGVFVYNGYLKKSKQNQYKENFKKEVIEKFVNEYNGKLSFYAERGMSIPNYQDAEFEHFDRYYSEDSIIGLLDNGNKIHMAEIHTEKESKDNEGHTSYSTIFWGLFAKIELEKIIPTRLRIRKDALIELFNQKEKMNMDSSEFEKYFTVYSTDKILAMQILTAEVMQILINFKNDNKITPEITLKDNKIYIRFNTGKIFEGNLLKKALDFDTLLRYYNIINFTLKLSENIVKNVNELEI